MLQQTQVSTVIPYFERFMARFPDIPSLSNSSSRRGAPPVDRARLLRTCAQSSPRSTNHRPGLRRTASRPDAITACGLPGIGRSTANATPGICIRSNTPHPRRQRKAGVGPSLSRARLARQGKNRTQGCGNIAAFNTPKQRAADYTQAIMDLGAMICVRRRPLCTTCPIAGTCQALCHREQALLPTPAPKREKPLRSISMVMIQLGGSVLLERRPPSGIWGGLWSFPEVEPGVNIQHHISSRFGVNIRTRNRWDVLRHSFTHFHLDITPVHAEVELSDTRVMENPGSVWYNLTQPDARGLAAPVKRLLEKLR